MRAWIAERLPKTGAEAFVMLVELVALVAVLCLMAWLRHLIFRHFTFHWFAP